MTSQFQPIENKSKLDGVVCHWQCTVKGNNLEWVLKDSYPISEDGDPLDGRPRNRAFRWHYEGWMHKRPKGDVSDPIQKEGRAVTMWSFERGIQLIAFHPPEWTNWVGSSFYEHLCKSDNWMLLIEKGHQLWHQTIEIAKKIVLN